MRISLKAGLRRDISMVEYGSKRIIFLFEYGRKDSTEQLQGPFRMDKEPPRLVKGYSKPIIVYRILDSAAS